MASQKSNRVDARGTTVNEVGRDQVNIAQLALGPNHSRTSLSCLNCLKLNDCGQLLWISTNYFCP